MHHWKQPKKINPTWLQTSLCISTRLLLVTIKSRKAHLSENMSSYSWRQVILGDQCKPVLLYSSGSAGEKCFGEDEDAAKTRVVGQRSIFQKTASLDGKSREASGVKGWQKPTGQQLFQLPNQHSLFWFQMEKEMPSGTSNFSTLHWGYLFIMYSSMDYIYMLFCISL